MLHNDDGAMPLATTTAVVHVLKTAKKEHLTEKSRQGNVDEDIALCSCYEKILSCSFAMLSSDDSGIKEVKGESFPGKDTETQGMKEESALEDRLLALRRLVISSGLPKTEFYLIISGNRGCRGSITKENGRGEAPSLRACVWKVLLGAVVADAPSYLALMKVWRKS